MVLFPKQYVESLIDEKQIDYFFFKRHLWLGLNLIMTLFPFKYLVKKKNFIFYLLDKNGA